MLMQPGFLSLEQLREIHAGGVRLELPATAREAIRASQQVVQRAADGDAPVYGALPAGEAAGLVPRVPIAAFLANLRALDDLALESSTDPLTRLGNRRSFDLRLEQAVNAARERRIPLSVLVLDADRFKEVNDSWGHPVGDAVLTRIADCLRAERNPPRDIFRIGGSCSFAICLCVPSEDTTIAAKITPAAIQP
jgi:GGDEF domain-containing protein